jgi:hypothetical protein
VVNLKLERGELRGGGVILLKIKMFGSWEFFQYSSIIISIII